MMIERAKATLKEGWTLGLNLPTRAGFDKKKLKEEPRGGAWHPSLIYREM